MQLFLGGASANLRCEGAVAPLPTLVFWILNTIVNKILLANGKIVEVIFST